MKRETPLGGETDMDPLRLTADKEKCTVIESFHGEVKLIKRSDPSGPPLEKLTFSSLRDCLDYVRRNNFEVNVVHSGKGKNEGKK